MYLMTSPLTWVCLGVAAVGLGGTSAPWRKVLRHTGWVVLISGLALCTPSVANALVRWLESVRWQAAPATACAQRAQVAVLLMGGFDRPPARVNDVAALTDPSLVRVQEGVRWAQQHGVRRLVLSGGGPFAISESVVGLEVAQWQRPPPDMRMSLEQASTTTWESAQAVAQLGLPRAVPIVLMTSALHLPRATLAFAAHGVMVCPVATDSIYLPPGGGIWYHVPQLSAALKSAQVMHEVVGLAYYAWRVKREGRSTAGF